MVEKRHSPRFEKQFILSYYNLKDPESISGVSTMKDISRGGLSFCSAHSFSVGDDVGIQLRTSLHPVPIHFEGKAVFVSQHMGQSIYLVRMRFTELSDEAIMIVDKIVQLLSSRK
jgi:Tfp pilus assembly protein PilZ